MMWLLFLSAAPTFSSPTDIVDVAALLRELRDKNPEAIASAAIKMQELALVNPKAVTARLPEIVKVLLSSSDEVKGALCQTIKNLKGETEPHSKLVLTTMLGLMSKEHAGRGLYSHARQVIDVYGKRGARHLATIVQQYDGEMRHHALLCLGHLEEDANEVAEQVEKMLVNSDTVGHSFDLAKTLIRLDPNNKIAKEKLLHLASEGAKKDRSRAAYLIARFPEYRRIVASALVATSAETASNVVELVELQMALLQMGSDAPSVIELLNRGVRNELIQHREGLRGLMAAAIRARINPTDSQALEFIRSQRKEIEGMLSSKDSSIRVIGVHCAASAIDDDFRKILSELRKDRSAVVRQSVANSLQD